MRLEGDATHDLRVSYIVEMPLWKPAYRIVVGDDGEPLLQGWAVVDNVSGEDWNNVQLSLVAGTPMWNSPSKVDAFQAARFAGNWFKLRASKSAGLT